MAPRRKKPAADRATATDQHPVTEHPVTEQRGSNAKGAVRPADNRYLSDDQLDERDAYLLATTGPGAQQLVAKRAALRVLLEQLPDDELAGYMPEGFTGGRVALLDTLEDSATTMANTTYRELLEALTGALAHVNAAGATLTRLPGDE